MKYLKNLRLLPVLLFSSALLQAHTGLESASPADGAVIKAAPAALELNFSGDVQLLKLELATAAGAAQQTGFEATATAAKTFSVPLPALTPAAYMVNWTVLGADGHRVEGNFGFTVDPAATEAAGTAGAHSGH